MNKTLVFPINLHKNMTQHIFPSFLQEKLDLGKSTRLAPLVNVPSSSVIMYLKNSLARPRQTANLSRDGAVL